MTSRERAAFARAARWWRCQILLGKSFREHVNFVESLGPPSRSFLDFRRDRVIAGIAESLSLDGVAVRG